MGQAIILIIIFTAQKPAKNSYKWWFSVDYASSYYRKLDITFYDNISDNRVEREPPDRGVVTEWPPPPLPVPREH